MLSCVSGCAFWCSATTSKQSEWLYLFLHVPLFESSICLAKCHRKVLHSTTCRCHQHQWPAYAAMRVACACAAHGLRLHTIYKVELHHNSIKETCLTSSLHHSWHCSLPSLCFSPSSQSSYGCSKDSQAARARDLSLLWSPIISPTLETSLHLSSIPKRS